MANTIYEKYLETEILTADPLKLVIILYRAAIESVAAARTHLATGAIRARSGEIMRVWEIVGELTRSLDHRHGVAISRPLADLYAYMQTRLIEANTKQIDPPLAEVEGLLLTLLEAWAATPAMRPPAVTPEYVPVSCVS
jgi:flagellar protein FliS